MYRTKINLPTPIKVLNIAKNYTTRQRKNGKFNIVNQVITKYYERVGAKHIKSYKKCEWV